MNIFDPSFISRSQDPREAGGGLYRIAMGIVFAIVAAAANAWILLVEILR